MTNPAPKAEIAKAFLKVTLTQSSNRCEQCGKRLKYQPGAWITSTGARFQVCRACGHDNPTVGEKVAESLREAGYDVDDIEGVLDLPQCLGDGTELQVSRDFTKVFCSTCGREWDRYEFEDIMGGALSPQLAGAIPMKPDSSKVARDLDKLIDDSIDDAGSPFFVVEVFEVDSPQTESFFAAFKDGWNEGKTDTPASSVNRPLKQYLAIYDTYLAHYSWDGFVLSVNEVEFSELFSAADAEITIPFEVGIPKYARTVLLGHLARFRAIHRANAKPYEAPLFGEAARQAEKEKSASPVAAQPASVPPASVADELAKLASLVKDGFLTMDEFNEAKARLLNS